MAVCGARIVGMIMFLCKIPGFATARASGRVLRHGLVGVLSALTLSACYEMPAPLIDKGEYAPIAGWYSCLTERGGGNPERYVIHELKEGTWAPDYRYIAWQVDNNNRQSKFESIINLKKINGKTYILQEAENRRNKFPPLPRFPPLPKKERNYYVLGFLDLSFEGKLVVLRSDLSGKRPYIEDLAAKTNVKLKSSGNAAELHGNSNDIVNFLKSHDLSLKSVWMDCKRGPDVHADQNPAGDEFLGKWKFESDVNIFADGKDFAVVVNEGLPGININPTFELKDGALIYKTQTSNTMITAVSSNELLLTANGKEVARWQRAAAPATTGPGSAFVGPWKETSIKRIFRSGNDFFMQVLDSNGDEVTHWTVSGGSLAYVLGWRIKYDKTKDTLLDWRNEIGVRVK